ncbi:hypothetical protein R69619_03741 [Paraburkholderia nemoris]|uniref:hypothetical protein n=1 Tax=Paraburkholderia nemoris TaxID=2793076 RepID=UPI00190B2464|nr:hypothetical protein [Paraburkholderia nemoris]MBK3743153.1 hypothetical protein [Paraburkholderia aspalathi]CAE6768732.1 hypothetical protein R69619_03741 [Paraburkholderia nemoris]
MHFGVIGKAIVDKLLKISISALIYLLQHSFKWLVLPVLKQSHDAYLTWKMSRVSWDDLCEGVRVKFYRTSLVDEDPERPSIVLVENVGISDIDELEFDVVATLGTLEFVDPLRVRQLAAGKKQWVTLANFPVEGLSCVANGIAPSYEVFFFRIHGGRTRDGATIRASESHHWHPTHFDLLNGCRLRLFGKVWHVGAIRDLEQELIEKIRWHLCFRGKTWIGGRLYLPKLSRRITDTALSGLAALITLPIVIKTVCWGALLLRLQKIPVASER